ncbi:CBS domain protein [Enterococcus faecalis EnGen0297]|nr:CBS domain protein [Enterococcus faecalis EnGen0297]
MCIIVSECTICLRGIEEEMMKLSKRQEQIIAVVKEHQPVSGERISDILAVSRATLRSDLSFLTLSGILKASPKVGYTYESDNMEAFFFFDVFQTKVQEIMSPPLMVAQDTSIRDAITNLFMYDVGSLYVMDEAKELLGGLSRKDLLRASLNTNIDGTPVAVCMTRVPHVKTCTPEFTILEAADTLQKYEVDSLPVVEKENPKKVIGKITKTKILTYITQQAKEAAQNR